MKAVIYGFGEIGRLLAKQALKRDIEISGVVDINPSLVGKKLSEFGLESDIKISNKLEFDGDIVFLTTGSWLDSVYPQIEECVKRGFNVLNTCETLSYPEYRYPELAKKIDEIAKKNNLSVLGAGINPGFLLDTLLIVLSAPFTEVRKIKAVRSADALQRRKTFQKKVGVGMDATEVEQLVKEGKISGHVGYAESVMLICDALKFKPDEVKEGQKVVDKDGVALGLKGYGAAIKNGDEVVRVEFHAYSNAENYEEVAIEGDNTIKWRSSGTKGDLGTVSVLINLAEFIINCKPGLIKISDIIPFKSVLKS
ncbi:dihydrodipicolinate reductase [Archaeoglobales archaeon]|nr:MAG: dihydrodipicolinate reductase [Archaeoglobales archaeon]